MGILNNSYSDKSYSIKVYKTVYKRYGCNLPPSVLCCCSEKSAIKRIHSKLAENCSKTALLGDKNAKINNNKNNPFLGSIDFHIRFDSIFNINFKCLIFQSISFLLVHSLKFKTREHFLMEIFSNAPGESIEQHFQNTGLFSNFVLSAAFAFAFCPHGM